LLQRTTLYRFKNYIVHKRIAGEFIKKFVEEAEKLRVGMPWKRIDYNALTEREKGRFSQRLSEDAKRHGGR